ncbi:MMPL family transporter [Tsukamurella paurometabola]|uniref:MMPL family transporter n=1 Tax=Tsukamurella paurometabola TaxID=2061 RepID=A0ABS5NFM3_TSUPA|nr:MMPL family transporter [Tsukamurella paurometabola]MBS4103074.1 MMPL family transporter [Tsukamurella paurometabola]
MSLVLYRLSRWSFRRHWVVIGAWALLLIGVVAGLMVSPPKLNNEVRIDGTPAQQVIDDLAEKMPASSGGQGIIAFTAPEGQRIDSEALRKHVANAVDAVYDSSPHVVDSREIVAAEAAKGQSSALLSATGAVGQTATGTASTPTPFVVNGAPVPGVVVSADGRVALMQFQFDQQTFELPGGTVDETVDAAKEAVDDTGIQVLPSATMLQIPELIGIGEVIGVLIAAVVLIMTLGSVVAAGLPLVTALTGVGIGVGGALLVAHVIEVHSLAVVLALMLGLAVGIDYALFIVNKQRRLILDRGLSAEEAAARAVGTAGSAVVFAGSTVTIALLALSVVGIRVLTTMAVVAAATVIIAVLLAITLLPALLGLIGERVCSAKARAHSTTHDAHPPHPVATRWVGVVTRHPYLTVAATVVLAALLAVPAAGMQLGLTSGSSYNPSTPQRQSYEVIAEHMGDGYNAPLAVAVTPSSGTGEVSDATLAEVAATLRSIDGVADVALQGIDDQRSTAVLSVVPTTGPTDPATSDVVERIRDHAQTVSGATIGVTGFAALGIDVSHRLADALPIYLGVVIGLSLIILILVFRSIIVPVKATLGFLLSVAATFGATTAVFQWGWAQQLLGIDATAPVLSLLPIIITGVLYGLAMDYEVFLVSSMKEARTHGAQGVEAVEQGFTAASRVVVAAAIIMTAVFAGFIFNEDPMIKQAGFALAFGVCFDAFVVRMTLVPAVMAAVGDKAWWLPKIISKRLPNLDIEGDQLSAALDKPDQAPAHA